MGKKESAERSLQYRREQGGGRRKIRPASELQKKKKTTLRNKRVRWAGKRDGKKKKRKTAKQELQGEPSLKQETTEDTTPGKGLKKKKATFKTK